MGTRLWSHLQTPLYMIQQESMQNDLLPGNVEHFGAECEQAMHCSIELLCIAETRFVTLLSTKMLNSLEKIVMYACREELVME